MAPRDSGRGVVRLFVTGLAMLAIGCGRTPDAEPAKEKPTGRSKADSGPGAAPSAPASSAGPSVTALDEVDACTFLTSDDIKEVVGKPVVTTNHGAIQRPGICQFELGNQDQIVLTVYATAGQGAFKAVVGEDLRDLGDAAKINLKLRVIAVLEGEKSFALSIFVGNPEDRVLKEQLKLLATKVLERLE